MPTCLQRLLLLLLLLLSPVLPELEARATRSKAEVTYCLFKSMCLTCP